MNKKMLIIIAAAVVVLCGGGGAAYFFLSGSSSAAAIEQPVGILAMETFLTNINDPSGERHARVQVKLAVSPEETVSRIKSDDVLMARLRDQVITLLTSKTYDDLTDVRGKEAFRREIRERLNPLLTSGEVKEVLFSDFVVQ
jgi:flagellar FliL protein